MIKIRPISQPITETIRNGIITFIQVFCPAIPPDMQYSTSRGIGCSPVKSIAKTFGAMIPIRKLAIGNARVAIPMTVPFLLGNHCPIRTPMVKVAYIVTVMYSKAYRISHSQLASGVIVGG